MMTQPVDFIRPRVSCQLSFRVSGSCISRSISRIPEIIRVHEIKSHPSSQYCYLQGTTICSVHLLGFDRHCILDKGLVRSVPWVFFVACHRFLGVESHLYPKELWVHGHYYEQGFVMLCISWLPTPYRFASMCSLVIVWQLIGMAIDWLITYSVCSFTFFPQKSKRAKKRNITASNTLLPTKEIESKKTSSRKVQILIVCMYFQKKLTYIYPRSQCKEVSTYSLIYNPQIINHHSINTSSQATSAKID